MKNDPQLAHKAKTTGGRRPGSHKMKQVGGGNAAVRSSSTDEESDSCSAQSSSDANKECNAPQFSVLRSDSDGLRMKISAIRNNQESTNSIQNKGISNNNNVKSNKNSQHFLASKKRRKRKESSGTSSSYCSVCSRSESECSSNGVIKARKARVKRRKVNTGTSEKKSEGISTDSETEQNLAGKNVLSGSMLKGEPISTKRTALQCDVLPGGCISSSDNDIPALVSAAIKCVESCSESENQPFKPSKQYTSTLLQDYMAKTQMLGSSSSINKEQNSENNSKKILPCEDVSSNSTQNNSAQVKKKRGRPKKTVVPNIPKGVILDSADSGITSTAQSSSPSPNSHNNKKNNVITDEPTKETIQKSAPIQKLNLLSLDKQMYATERILYPPKGKKKVNSKPTGRTSKNKEDILDPLWKKIDVNSKFRRPSLTGYKSDGGTTICSKVLAARSGYVSDYGSVGNRPYSGYKSDASGKSRYSMRSYVSRAKSCDYRGGYTSGKSRKFRRKKQAIKSSKSLGNVNDQDILQLAGLSLGQSSEESSRESVCKPILTNSQSKKYGEINRFVRTGEYFGRNKKVATNDSVSEKNEASSKSNGPATSNLFSSFPQSCISSYEFQNFSKKIRLRRSSAVSRCSSFSTVSRCDVRKKRRHRPRLKSVRNYHIDSKLNTEVEILINSFSSLRLINLDKANGAKEKDKNEREKSCVQKTQSKRNLKKRKFSDNSEHHLINPILKRRHKRTSPDEHKLPLKKRHYLLTPGEKSEGKNLHNLEVKTKDSTLENKPISGKNCTNANSKIASKAITPKKRHLLETSKNNSSDENEQVNIKGASSTSESKSFSKSVESRQDGSLPKAGQPKSEKDIVKKKNRLEGLVTKIQTANTTSLKDGVLTNPESTGNFPPPGIFEPSDELEIQIPVSELATSIVTKAEVDSPKVADYSELNKSLTEPKFERVVETLLNKTGGNLILKRKRRKTNRTGFPSVKKKKRKTTIDEVQPGGDLKCKEDIPEESVGIKSINSTNSSEKLCDRVPRMGEASDSFLERHRKPRLSVVSLEKLQDPVKRLDKMDSTEMEVKAPKKATVSNNKHEQIIEKSSVANTKLNCNAAKVLIRKKPGARRRRGRKPWYNRNVKISKYKIAQVKGIESQEVKDNLKSRTTCVPEAPLSDKQKINKVENNSSDSNKVNTTQKKEKLCENISPEDLEQEPLPVSEGPNESDELSSLDDKSVKNKKYTRWRKTYLNAGLLSDYYKSDIKTRKITSERLNKQVGQSSDDPNSGLLPPPPYCEKFYRKTVNDFMLPYDVWWAYKNSKLPSRVTVPSWNYKRIRTNVYGDVRPSPAIDHQACNCKPLAACGDDCLNRMVYTECSPSNCPCGEKCENQKIQKHDIAPGIERFMTENKGWGVKTSLPIRKGTYILEYVGEVVTEKEFKERMATLYVNDIHHYCLNLDGGLVIDGHRMGSDGRFVNHSCSPNCEMQKWSVNGLFRMALFASRNIQAGEELTYDYNFSLFNPSEGQPCRCNTPQCRGVIGGKSQRVKPLEQKPTESQPQNGVNKFGRARKRQAKKITGRFQSKDIVVSLFQQPTDREKKIARGQHCFLIRNLEKVRKLKMKLLRKDVGVLSRPLTPVTLAVQITALRVPRNIKTRGLTQAAHDPEVEKIAKMAVILRDICISLENIKDNEEKSQLAKLLPAFKRKRPAHDRGSKIVDFPTIQANIERGFYKDPSVFDEDVNKVFTNALAHFGEHSREAAIVIELSHAYKEKKFEAYEKLSQIVPEKELTSFRPHRTKKTTVNSKTIEDIIQCICGLFKDEGLMIQCAKCLVWQHAECTKANIKADNYLCERCEPRIVNLEIPLDEYTEEGYRYYLSLLRGDLQIRQGDTVYVLRDIPIKDENGKVYETKKHTYETIGKIDYSECDIFRVERLWKNDEGKRFIFGHHYLRPHETFHEPSRKFYENEVIRVPLYEVVPIELVIARCWVLDRSTFCKGRPVDVTSEEHVYICELRVDKSARFFARAKQSYPTCTKNYAFRKFSEKIRISRTYTPHEVDPSLIKPKKRKTDEVPSQNRKILPPVLQLLPPPPKTVHEKRNRLENILGVLRKKQASLNSIPLDLSYLLTGRGARQRRAHAVNVPI